MSEEQEVKKAGDKLTKYIYNPLLKPLKNIYVLALIIVLIAALYIRWKYFLVDSIWNDETVYMWNSLQLYHNPLYLFSSQFISDFVVVPNIVMAFLMVFFKTFVAGRLMGLLFSLLGVIFIYLLGKEIKNEFVGLSAAILLTFNHLYGYLSDKALIDVPLTTMFILTAYCIIKFEKTQSRNWIIAAGIASILTFLTKTSGIILLLILAVYFLITRRTKIFQDKKALYLLSIPIGFLILASIIYYFIGGTFLIKSLFIKMVNLSGTEELFNYVSIFFSFVINWYVVPLLIIGVLFALLYRTKYHIYLLTWFIVFLAYFEYAVKGYTEPRYILPILPAGLLIISEALYEIKLFISGIIKINITSWLVVIVALLLAYPFYNLGIQMHEQKDFGFSGYQDAGAWLKNNAEQNAYIYTTAPRQIRAFAERNFEEHYGITYGGTVNYINKYKTVEEFIETIKDKPEPIYLFLDIWESGQPEWVSPLDMNKIQAILNKGFVGIYTINKDLQTPEGVQPVTVGVILKRAR